MILKRMIERGATKSVIVELGAILGSVGFLMGSWSSGSLEIFSASLFWASHGRLSRDSGMSSSDRYHECGTVILTSDSFLSILENFWTGAVCRVKGQNNQRCTEMKR